MKWVRTLFSKLASHISRSAFEAHRWFRAGGTFWIWLATTIAILLVFYVLVPGKLPDRVRWAGAVFGFLGISAVVLGINRTRRSFGRPSVLQGTWIWLGEVRFIFFRRPPITVSGESLAPVGAMVGVGTVVSRAPNSTEARVAQLEKQVTELQAKFGNIEQKVEQQKQELRTEIDKEAAARQAADQGVSRKLEEGMVGDNQLELAGVFYLYLGLVMVHLSTEVAMGLEWLGFT